MKRLDRLMLAFYGLGYIAFGIALVLGKVPMVNQMFVVGLGCLVCLSGISILNIIFLTPKDKKNVIFKTKKGDVSVNLVAIEDFVRKTISRMGEVRDIKSKVLAKSKGLKVKSRVMLTTDIGVTTIIKKIQKEIELNIKEMLGVDIRVKVDVNVMKVGGMQDVKKELKKLSKLEKHETELEKKEEQIAAQDFNGIEY